MRTHTCEKGDTLSILAQKYQLDLELLQYYNGHISDPMQNLEGVQVTLPSVMGLTDFMPGTMDGKGNVCAYVPDKPVYYKKLNITHWPSQDVVNGGHIYDTSKSGANMKRTLPAYHDSGWNDQHGFVSQYDPSLNRGMIPVHQEVYYPQYQYPVNYYYPYSGYNQ